MLIPSIDLMGGKIVQLIQGEKKALEFDNFDEWIARFSRFSLVQLIDLDAAMGGNPNSALLAHFVSKLPCQVGGGIRSLDAARRMVSLGARRVIVGSSLIANAVINVGFAQQLAGELGREKLVFAIDCKGGRVAVRGWKEITGLTPIEMIRSLESFCSAFLYTHIDTEGLMQGLPLDPVRELRAATTRQFIAAGGITTEEEVATLDRMGVDAVVGMALYRGVLALPDTIPVQSN